MGKLQGHPEEACLEHEAFEDALADGCLPSALQDILEEVRKELQKVKVEIIGGGLPFLCLSPASLACANCLCSALTAFVQELQKRST